MNMRGPAPGSGFNPRPPILAGDAPATQGSTMAKTEVLGIGDMRANYGRVREDMRTRTSRRMLVAAGTVLKRKATS